MVLIHVVLDSDYCPDQLSDLDAVRTRMYEALREPNVATIFDVQFTTDRQWGAPLPDGGFGGTSVELMSKAKSVRPPQPEP